MEYTNSKQREQRELLLRVLRQQKFTDTTFIIGADKKVYNVNRIFLGMISPVFEAMLYGKMKEGRLNSDVVIDDIEPKVFESLIDFAYCNNPNISDDNVVSLHQIADKYQIQILLIWCDEYLKSNLNETNICAIFTESVRLKQSNIMQHCYQYMALNVIVTTKILKSNGFKEMGTGCMRELLELDRLSVTEESLWSHVVKWALYQSKAEQHKVQLLRTVYDLIRFGSMDGRFFTTKVIEENILSKDEIIAVLTYYQNPSVGCGKFLTAKRTTHNFESLLPYDLQMSSKHGWGINTYKALISRDLSATCTTRTEKRNFVLCLFTDTVCINRIEIAPPKIVKVDGTYYGNELLNGAKLFIKKGGEWKFLQTVPHFKTNSIQIIYINDIKTNRICIGKNNVSSCLSIGCLRVYGLKSSDL